MTWLISASTGIGCPDIPHLEDVLRSARVSRFEQHDCAVYRMEVPIFVEPWVSTESSSDEVDVFCSAQRVA